MNQTTQTRLKSILVIFLCFLGTLPALGKVEKGKNQFPADWFWGEPADRAAHDSLIGKKMPTLEVSHWMNGGVTPEMLQGKIVVLDLWATWCGPCIAAIPENNELSKDYASRGVVLIGICGSSRGQEKMESVAGAKKITYPLAKDDREIMAKAFNLRFWPTYVIVDREGLIRAVGLQPGHVKQVVDTLLKETPAAASAENGAAASSASREGTLEMSAAAGSLSEAKWREGTPEVRVRLKGLEGSTPPALQVTNWQNSEPLTLDKLKGKVVLLDCWGVWCGPCIASIPETNEIAAKYGPDGLVVIGICEKNRGNEMPSVAKEKGIKYPVALDAENKTLDSLKVDSFPDYYLIDRSGKLRIADCNAMNVEDAIKILLAEK